MSPKRPAGDSENAAGIHRRKGLPGAEVYLQAEGCEEV